MPDAQRAVWKEKFLAGLPHGLGDLVRSRLKEANLDFMTYGELFAAIDQMLIERCTQKKVENAERKAFSFRSERVYVSNSESILTRIGSQQEDTGIKSLVENGARKSTKRSQAGNVAVIVRRKEERRAATSVTSLGILQRIAKRSELELLFKNRSLTRRSPVKKATPADAWETVQVTRTHLHHLSHLKSSE